MTTEDNLRQSWQQTRERLRARQLLGSPQACLSLRIPGAEAMWFGHALDDAPCRIAWADAAASGAYEHAAIYRARGDVGAISLGGGAWGRCLPDFGRAMPQAFDEQARHIGPMGPALAQVRHVQQLARGLQAGGNVLFLHGLPVCLGTTATRMALNTELFEKCAKACVLAAAAGGPVKPLPWLVRTIANRRLRRDRQRAVDRFMQGLLPEESKGY